MKGKLSFSSFFVIGVMLFALFFGAGNLIFPAQLGQEAGTNLIPALVGFLITGVGLPLIGILAMGFSGSSNLQQLAGRVHPVYALIFTAMLYLTIGPFFAIPRTATVAFDIGITPFVNENSVQTGLFVFSLLFFVATLWLSLNPSRLVERVGKILAPGIIILLALLLLFALINPIGSISSPHGDYVSGPFVKGFLEGYNTMDALASLVFGIIVINAIKAMGITSKREILTATVKSGLVAVLFLALIYVGIAYLGATTTATFGLFETGGQVLNSASTHYFGTLGTVILAVIIILACITTSIGLITACGEYFHTLFPKISYKQFAAFFSLVSFIIANFGLANIINYSIPVLMFLYPLAIVLMLLTFLSPLFNHARAVYVSAITVTIMVSFFDGLTTLCKSLGIENFAWMKPIIKFYENTLPLYETGLGWVVPVLVVTVISFIIVKIQQVTVEKVNA